MHKLDKLEQKVDVLKEDMAELKADVKAHIATSQVHMDVIKSHIAGDQKIINAIEPLIKELPDLVEIVRQYNFEKELKERRKEKLVLWTKRLSFFGACCALLDWFRKVFH